MAYLMPAKTPDEIKKIGVAATREAYNKLAVTYNKMLDGDLCYCHKCNTYKSSNGFYNDNSYASGLFPLCKECLQAMATDYDKTEKAYVDNREKTIRVFQMMNLPFIDSLYNSALKDVSDRVGEKNKSTAYLHMLTMVKSLTQYKNKTWADSEFDTDLSSEEDEINENSRILKTAKKRFGKDYSPADLVWLENNYTDWCNRTQVDSLSQETYVKQICLQLLDIDKDRKSGKDVTNKLKALDTLMNSANLQPKQNISNAQTDSLTFGQLIERWEQEAPIPEPSEEFKDVDGIGKYIRVWFSGWLGKALGLKNTYTQECEEYIEQYKVSKPEYQEEGRSEEIYEQLFGSDGD